MKISEIIKDVLMGNFTTIHTVENKMWRNLFTFPLLKNKEGAIRKFRREQGERATIRRGQGARTPLPNIFNFDPKNVDVSITLPRVIVACPGIQKSAPISALIKPIGLCGTQNTQKNFRARKFSWVFWVPQSPI